MEMWRIGERRLVVISAETALSEEEVGVIIMMSVWKTDGICTVCPSRSYRMVGGPKKAYPDQCRARHSVQSYNSELAQRLMGIRSAS